MFARFYLTFVLCYVGVQAQFEIPEIHIQALNPKGLRVAIEALPGIKLFGFHSKINDELNEKESGSINKDVTVSKDGRFIVEDLNAAVAVGDVVNYWVFVQYESLGYRKDGQTFKIEALVPPNTPFPPLKNSAQTNLPTRRPTNCEKSKTVSKGASPCKGFLIFEDNFAQTLVNTKWTREQKLSSEDQENEFVSYQPSNVEIVGTTLKITPTLQHNAPNFNRNDIVAGKLDLTAGCTSGNLDLCSTEADSYNILPPIISGKISTKDNFSFKYGKIEIKAKVPQGDWIYPEFYLEPANSKYGSAGYESGIIRIAFVRGNLNLTSGAKSYGNNVLSGGVVLEQSDPCRAKGIRESPDVSKRWGDDFHVYGLVWKEDMITLEVDKKQYATITPPGQGFKSLSSDPSCNTIVGNQRRLGTGSVMAPFDQEFYLSIGLGVGGISDFPTDVTKPWKNTSPKARMKFWQDEANWYATWGPKSSLIVDSVKIWAL